MFSDANYNAIGHNKALEVNLVLHKIYELKYVNRKESAT